MCLNIFKQCKNNKYEKLKEDKLRQIINEISMEWECPICFKNLEEGLKKVGFSDTETNGILGNNWYNFYKTI